MTGLPDHGPLAVRRLPATTAGDHETLVLLHGWGMHSGIWEPLLPRLRERFALALVDLPGFGDAAGIEFDYDPAALLEALALAVGEPAHFLGWSLGGNLAAAFAARYPARVRSLATVATTPRFVAARDWPCGMDCATFDAFSEQAKREPAKCRARFTALQARGEGDERAALRWLRDLAGMAPVPHPASAAAALDWLGALDQRADWARLAVARRHYFAAEDALVAVAAAAAVDDSVVLHGCGHAPMLSQQAALLDDWLGFAAAAAEAPAPLDKRRIAASFSRAAPSYDAVAHLQRDVGTALARHLPPSAPHRNVVDLGCGTGYFLPQLRHRFATADVTAVDIAEGMLAYARRRRAGAADAWLAADAEALPLADASVDLLFSSLTLQWCDDLDRVFAEATRVLAPGGRLLFSTLTDGTLAELRGAWDAVDGYVHVNRFLGTEAWRRRAVAADLQCDVWQCREQVLRYPALAPLLAELKALGAHNVNAGRPAGLTGRRALQALEGAYERYRGDDGLLPATYAVAIGAFRK